MTRFWLTLISVVLMFALPMFAPAEHRGVVGLIVGFFGMIAVSYLSFPQPQGRVADGRDKIIEGLTVQVGMLESALTVETANVRDAQAESGRLALELSEARADGERQMTLALGDDPRIEVVYGSAAIDRSKLDQRNGRPFYSDYRNTQNPDVLTKWVREGRKTWANTALRTSDGNLYFLREGAPVNLISNLVR